MTNYIAFGCWNKIKDKEDFIQEFFLEYLNNEIKTKKFGELNFLAILGDNYYPNKVKTDKGKKKNYNEENLFRGFRFLDQINLPKKFIHGNHDIKDFPKECQLVEMGLTNKGVYKDHPIYSVSVYPHELHTEIGNTLLFFLDSTIYDDDFKDDTIVQSTCYKNIFPKSTYIKDIKEYQIEYVNRILESTSSSNIIFHFHHPILSKKQKDGRIKPKTDYNDGLINFYNSINAKLNGKKIYHICADTHFYENSHLEFNGMKINQYIVGTGGADLDNPLPYDRETKTEKDVNYRVIDTKKNYGFLHIYSSFGELKFNFIEVPEEALKFSEKYLKYKLKYFILKNFK